MRSAAVPLLSRVAPRCSAGWIMRGTSGLPGSARPPDHGSGRALSNPVLLEGRTTLEQHPNTEFKRGRDLRRRVRQERLNHGTTRFVGKVSTYIVVF